MAVMIKGMEMPESCWHCPCIEGFTGFCKLNWEPNISPKQKERPDWCPLIEVPEPKAVIAKEDLEAAGFET